MVSFGILLAIVLAGLGGPLLGLSERRFVPVVIGEIAAGVIVGKTGLGIVDPTDADDRVPRRGGVRDADADRRDAPAAARSAAWRPRCAAARCWP